MILTNGRLIFPDRIEEAWSLRIAHGQIEEIGPAIVPNDEEIIDLGGNYLAPGFIDLHVHGAIGRDTMEGTEEAFRGICNYHAGGGQSDAWAEEARAGWAGGMRQGAHPLNCMSSRRRRGRERVAGLLEVALGEPEIFCELIADGEHVSATLMRMLYRAKGAGGICLVTDATAGAGLPNETRFSLFGNDCVVAEGACWLADRSRLAGSAARMIDLVRQMINLVGVPLPEAVRMATETPARAMNWKTKGLLAKGTDADLVVLSPSLQIVRTYCRGLAQTTQ